MKRLDAACYAWVVDGRGRIERKTDVLGGEPVVRGTRVPVRALVGGLAGGMSIDEVSASYRVSVDDVRAALQYALEALGDERALGTPSSQ